MSLNTKQGIFLLFAIFVLTFASPVRAQDNCKADISKASDNFEIGRADDVIRLLDNCLENKNIEKADRIDMYRLLALSHLAKRDSTTAYTYVQSLIKTHSRYRSRTITDDPQFQTWVDELRPEWHERWLWRGVIAGGVTGAVLGYRALTAEDQPLPFPPTGPQ